MTFNIFTMTFKKKFAAKSSYTAQDLDLLRKEISCKTLSDTSKIDIMQQAVAPCPEIEMSIKVNQLEAF